MKITFSYLVRQDEKTWNDFNKSIFLLEKKILSRLNCKYDILIFCEGKPNIKAEKIIEFFKKEKKINIIKKIINLKNYVARDKEYDDIPHAARCELLVPIGYRDMCKFYAQSVFFDKHLDDSDYFIRLDTDSFFIDVRKKFIDQLNNLNCDYAYILNTDQYEDKAVSLGFGNCLYNYCQLNKTIELDKNYFQICSEATLKPKIFYTNFEVVKLKWVRNKPYNQIADYIVKTEGIYKNRWGDAMIRYYITKLINTDIKILNGCLYKHSGTYDSRSLIRRMIAKVYCKLTNNLFSNNFESYFSKFDNIFLGIKN